MEDFITKFQTFVTENKLFDRKDRVLLAVSGGVDSMVMCHLFQAAKFNFALAHCNFKLRGEASDGDEAFVRAFAQSLQVPFFTTSFATKKIAETEKISIQMAARDLRYDWLEAIRQQNDFQWIATAHHLNDSIETFFYNFTKGTGIRGLQGIPLQNGHVIRPLLFATKNGIVAFANEKAIPFREDASNEEDKYARNKIRHHVIPTLLEINPNFEQTSAENLRRMQETAYLFDWAIGQIQENAVETAKGITRIKVAEILKHQAAVSTILYELLHPFGFHADQIAQMLASFRIGSGAIFYSQTHQLLVDRLYFIIEKRTFDTNETQFVIAEGVKEFDTDVGNFTIEHKTGQPETFTNDEFSVFLDAEKVTFPLTLRHWQAGDFFYPLGLGGKRQKLQDFFTNQKIPRFEKERVWLLLSGDAVCWLVGHRLDERFKITDSTKEYLVIKFQKT